MSNRQRVKLSTICDIYDGTHQTPKYVDSGVKFLSVENINDIAGSNKFISEEDYNRDFKVRPERNDILMTRIGDIGTPAIVNDDSAYAYYVSLALLKCKQDRVYPQWLKQAITTNDFQHQLWLKTLHVAFPKKINKGEIGECLISLPPIEEQQYTAKVFNKVDEVIAEREEEVKDLEQQKKGLMQKIFSQQLRFTDSNNNPYPDWKEKNVGNLGTVITGSTPKTEDKSNYGNDFLWCSPADLGSTKYITQTQKMLSSKGFNCTRKLPANSILVTCIGSTIGKIGISSCEMSTNQQINSIIPCNNNSDFIYYALIYSFPRYMSVIATQAVPIINKTEFEKLTLQVPCLEEQQKIANVLSKLDELIEEKKALLSDWQQFKKGLLQQMFV